MAFCMLGKCSTAELQSQHKTHVKDQLCVREEVVLGFFPLSAGELHWIYPKPSSQFKQKQNCQAPEAAYLKRDF
jgi:hypothetical protein